MQRAGERRCRAVRERRIEDMQRSKESVCRYGCKKEKEKESACVCQELTRDGENDTSRINFEKMQQPGGEKSGNMEFQWIFFLFLLLFASFLPLMAFYIF